MRSGALVAYKATGIGSGRPAVMDLFEKEYKEDMSYNAAIKLGLKALEAAIEEKPNAETVEIGVADVGKKFRRLSEAEIESFLKETKKPKA